MRNSEILDKKERPMSRQRAHRLMGTTAVVSLAVGLGVGAGIEHGVDVYHARQVAGEKPSGQTLTVEPGWGWMNGVDTLRAEPDNANAHSDTREDDKIKLEKANPGLAGRVLQPGDVIQVPVDLAAPSHKK